MSINTTASRYRIIRRFRLRGVEFPIADVVRPAALAGEKNGKLPASKMVTFPLAQGGNGKILAGATARSWLALMWVAKVVYGAQLTATSSGDTYRDYPGQERGWLRRNTLTRLPGRPSRLCGYQSPTPRRWWLKPFMAGIACPGTSNHGWAQAIDHGIYVVTSVLKRGKVDRPVAWLKWFVPVAQSFGWSWEAPTEDWHIRYVLGDLVPRAVSDVEVARTSSVLTIGSKGAEVVAWQRVVGATPDGAFGPKTKAKVTGWQQAQRGWYGGKGLPADGIIDADDWYALAHPTMAVA